MSRPAWAGTLASRGERVLLPTYARYPLEIAAGRGARLVDSGGRAYLDLVAGVAVNVLGYGHPVVARALEEAAGGLLHASNLYWTEPMVRLAERLTSASGMEKAFFCNSGAEAVEAALKLARRARPGRPGLVCFTDSFHGRTLGALSVTAQSRYQDPFQPLLPGVVASPLGDTRRVAAALTEQTAAVIVEPIQGEGGMRPAPPGFLPDLRRLCDDVGALLILDEVQTGIGRTGAFFAYQHEEVRPDLVVAAKGLAGGLPMGVLLARGEAAAAFTPGDHGCTFGGGPLVAHVADAVVRTVLAPGFLDEVRRKGEHLRRRLEELAERHPVVVETRGRGLMQGLALAAPRAAELVTRLRDRGVLAAPAGASVLRLVPPLVIEEAEIDAAAAALDAALGGLEAAKGADGCAAGAAPPPSAAEARP